MSERPPSGAILLRTVPIYQIFGANTNVGKTLLSTLLLKAAPNQGYKKTAYLKPVSTGPESESDASHVKEHATNTMVTTLYQYELAASPHIAATQSDQPAPSDNLILQGIRHFASQFETASHNKVFVLVETAGGVHSPGPSGAATQADLYAPLRLPVILVGDGKLGGISTTISSFEALRLRGYDIVAVVLFRNDTYKNHEYLDEYFQSRGYHVPVYAIPPPPPRDLSTREQQLHNLEPSSWDDMVGWYGDQASAESVSQLMSRLVRGHEKRIARLESMAETASKRIWYPFTQHTEVTPQNITVIDSAMGDFFQTLHSQDAPQQSMGLLQSSLDASASWWTQGLGHGNPKLALEAAYTAGRYGHVIFPGTIHEPALALAESLITYVGNPRLDRVFFSDNGSTGVEVAIKMALRATRRRYQWGQAQELGVLGLKGGYHGDTIGAMNCAEPGIFNQTVEWYKGTGYWLDFPTVLCVNGSWAVMIPEAFGENLGSSPYESLAGIFDFESRKNTSEAQLYDYMIRKELASLKNQGRRFGALLMEPVVLGAGGMALVDPLFQVILVDIVRKEPSLYMDTSADTEDGEASSIPRKGTLDWDGLPVVFDEVFTGLHRLGQVTAASFLKVEPDISIHAKLLTGGLLPLCVTLASESIFDAFKGEDKTDALLHGHSYTAHPVGCQVALSTIESMIAPGGPVEVQRSWTTRRHPGWDHESMVGRHTLKVWSIWSWEFVKNLSCNAAEDFYNTGEGVSSHAVKGVWALGTVLAVHMKGDTGYGSKSAIDVQKALFKGKEGILTTSFWNIHSRVLGNVVYIIASLTASEDTIKGVEGLITSILIN